MARKKAQNPTSSASRAVSFLQGLRVPTGPLAGRKIRLAPFQETFIQGSLADDVTIAAKSVARGNAKSVEAAGIALGHLVGEIDPQVRRECLIGARTRDQGRVVFEYVVGLSHSLPERQRARLKFRRGSTLEIEFAAPDGPHLIRVLASDGRTALGTSPTLCIADERAHWTERGDELEHALLSGLGKRGGRYIAISTSANNDAHPFSRLLDDPPPGAYVQEHRAPDGCAPDDIEAIRLSNPGAEFGIGASLEWLQAQARRAIQRGGAELTAFRLYNLNQRVSAETRDVLLTVDEWLACETDTVPPRSGKCIAGLDLGGSSSMTAASFFWPDTGRLESRGWFPSRPNLLDRGQMDHVGRRYVEMQERGELAVLGDLTVPVAPWLQEVFRLVEIGSVAAIVADRFKQSEIAEALDKAGIRIPVVWRGMGYRDGSEDCERFRRACYDGKVKVAPSLLLRSAMADAVCVRDVSANIKLAKARSTGKIDATCASVLAVAEGVRQSARPERKVRFQWA